MAFAEETFFKLPEEVPTIPAGSLIDKVEINAKVEGGLIDAYVPLELIGQEDVPIDYAHVEELAAAFADEAKKRTGTGQLDPVLLAEIPGADLFPIIDGFHRVPALHLNGHTRARATIRPDSTYEEVVDLRILATTSHKSVQFARVAEWVQDAWGKSPWADRIDATQAFTLQLPGATGRRLNLDPSEVDEIRNWVNQKCDKWHLKPLTVYDNLSVAKIADPELVNEARTSKGGNELKFITPNHLGVIAKAFPDQFDWQRLVADTTKAQNLRVPQTRALIKIISGAESIEAASALIAEIDWVLFKFKPEYHKDTIRKNRWNRVQMYLGWEATEAVDNLEDIFKALKTTVERTKGETGKYDWPRLADRLRAIGVTCLNQANGIVESTAEVEVANEDVLEEELIADFGKASLTPTPQSTKDKAIDKRESSRKRHYDPVQRRQVAVPKPAPTDGLGEAIQKFLDNGGVPPRARTLTDLHIARRTLQQNSSDSLVGDKKRLERFRIMNDEIIISQKLLISVQPR